MTAATAFLAQFARPGGEGRVAWRGAADVISLPEHITYSARIPPRCIPTQFIPFSSPCSALFSCSCFHIISLCNSPRACFLLGSPRAASRFPPFPHPTPTWALSLSPDAGRLMRLLAPVLALGAVPLAPPADTGQRPRPAPPRGMEGGATPCVRRSRRGVQRRGGSAQEPGRRPLAFTQGEMRCRLRKIGGGGG